MLHARKSYNERVQDSANLIPEDEPVFLLRGQDELAPVMLDIYVSLRGLNLQDDDEIAKAVREHANAMRKWQDERHCKVADMDAIDNVYGPIPPHATKHYYPNDEEAMYVWPCSDNTGYHAVRADFINMQVSFCGIAGTIDAAMQSLIDTEASA